MTDNENMRTFIPISVYIKTALEAKTIQTKYVEYTYMASRPILPSEMVYKQPLHSSRTACHPSGILNND